MPDEKRRRARAQRPTISVERLGQLRAMPYQEYLKSQEWIRRRHVVIKFAAARCQVCYSDQQPLQVHHRTYERLGCELLSDTVLLCDACHTLFHQHRKLHK